MVPLGVFILLDKTPLTIVGFNGKFGDTVKNSFFLVIPRQQHLPQRLKEFEAKALQQWLDELPAANLGLATRLIHDFIVEINTIIIPSPLRLDVLEKIRSNVLIIEDYLQSRLLKTGFPKDENENKIFEVLVSIQKECAIGYWSILKELTRRDAGWFKGKQTALAVQRCIEKLGRIAMTHYVMRVSVPDWVWIDVHSLYKLSIKTQGVAQQISQLGGNARTAEDCYKQVLLMHLADATGLIQKEIPEIYEFIETIAPLINLSTLPVLNQKQQCLIQTDEDKPPFFQSKNLEKNNNKSDAAWLYIDFTQLYKFMAQQEKSPGKQAGFLKAVLNMASQTAKAPPDFLPYLQQRWFGIELQGAPLFADRLDRYITIGLTAIHELSEDSGYSSPGRQVQSKDLYLAQTASDRLLAATFSEFGLLSVGSLVCFRKRDEPECNRSLGIINTLSVVNSNGKIAFGVHLVATRFYAVFCKQNPNTSKEVVQKGLYYGVKIAEGERYFVIADYFMFQDNDLVHLSFGQETFPVLMKNRKNIGLGYWQFECQRVVVHLPQEKAKKGYDFI